MMTANQHVTSGTSNKSGTTDQPINTDVLIVGAGLVGAAMALLLAKGNQSQHLRITLVDPVVFKPTFSDQHFDTRVVALTEISRQLLDNLGIWDTIQNRCCAYTQMQVEEAEGTGVIHFDAALVGQDALGHIVENALIVSELLKNLREQPNVEYICPAKVVALSPCEYGHRLTLDTGILDTGTLIETKLIIASDGANSTIRNLAGFHLREWSYGQQAIVCTITTEKPHQDTARQWFTPNGPLAFLPLSGPPDPTGHSCSIVWSQTTEKAEQLLSLSDKDFCRELTYASGSALGNISHCTQRFGFPLQQRHTKNYIKNGIALIGDAAHNIHPLAGQGVNLGFQDALALQESIEWGLEAGINPNNPKVLQRYQRQRKPDNLQMMLLMEGFKRLFGTTLPPVRLLRNIGLNRINSQALVKSQLIKQAMGLK